MSSQSPKFSFTKEFVQVSNTSSGKELKVYKGAYKNSDEILSKKALLGNVSRTDKSIRFTPLLSFQENKMYTAVFENEIFVFKIPLNPNHEQLKVVDVYPRTATLPSNFLKWYVEFSKPVNSTNIYNHISLVNNKTGKKVDRALLPLETPLISDDGKILTLWIEPGRQKRDLGPNKRLGEVLKEGESYTLLISKSLKDIEGFSMKTDFHYSFEVIENDRESPNITRWTLELPKSNTQNSLIINLNDTLDYGSPYNNVVIVDEKGKQIQGVFSINMNEERIVFRPDNNWERTYYTIHCNKLIEDVAGNNLERLFDRDIRKEVKAPILELYFSLN
ncbi:Ig-like domain-containing protein [Tenacibaculum sp. MEBiC06402]|uniref:Ig-like domain-containing protein n=1 Tax=unclassified Tenacibaculum TaxID=2635139 RepID=UPI003B9A6591